MQIKIIDWQKFNPRTDSKSHSWFRHENDYFLKTYSWSASEQRTFTYLCCCMSKEKKDLFHLDLNLASMLLKLKESQIKSDIKKLIEYGVVTSSNIELLDVTSSSCALRTYERNVRTNMPTSSNLEFDFEMIYGEYPKKIGKKKGIDSCKSQIKTQDEFDSLLLAIRRYSDHCKKERIEPKFIKHFSTFMNSWTDWILPNTGKVEISRPQPLPAPIQIIPNGALPSGEKELPDPEQLEKVRNLIATGFKRL